MLIVLWNFVTALCYCELVQYSVLLQNEVSAITPLPDSSTADQELIILSDSDSQESREAQAIVLKRPAKQENVIKPKIRRLEGPSNESPFNSTNNFTNRYLIKEENSESSSSKHVEKMNEDSIPKQVIN